MKQKFIGTLQFHFKYINIFINLKVSKIIFISDDDKLDIINNYNYGEITALTST